MEIADELELKRPEFLRPVQTEESAMRHARDNQNGEVWTGAEMPCLKHGRSHER